jgi:hypothetical protein
LFAALTVIDGDGMRAGEVEYNKILRTGLRARTARSGMAKLIPMSKVLEGVVIKKLPIPSLSNVEQSGDKLPSGDSRCTRCTST